MTACQLSLDGHAARARTAAPALPLRPYQEEALTAIDKAELRGISRPLVALPTGTGKTILFGHLLNGREGRGLVLAHRDELIGQAVGKLRQIAPGLEVGIVKAERDETGADVVVASIQTLARPSRLARLEADFRTIVVDECHHASAATYVAVLRHLGSFAEAGPLTVGVTATPERSDKAKLGAIWQEIVYQRSMLEMIAAGYLVDLRAIQVGTDADLGRLKVVHGDLQDAEIADELIASGAIPQVAGAYLKHARDRKGIAFTPTVRVAYLLASELTARGTPAEALDGTTATDERCAILGRLHTGATQVVVNCGVLCLDAETEILTDRGWAGVNEMSYAHRVANWDNGRVFFERPLEIVCRDRLLGEDMAILETVRRSVRVTGGHRMLYRTAPRAPWRKVPARELVGKKAELPICGSAEPFAVTPEQPEPVDERQRRRLISATAYNLRKREGFEWEASFKEAARRTDRKLCLRRKTPSELTLEECSLIGFWVGDGSVNRPRRGGVEYTLAQSTSYPTIVDWVDEKIAATGLHAVRRTVPSRPNVAAHIRWSIGRGTGSGSQEREGAFPLEPYLDKDGSPLLWGLNHDQFAALLAGLWCADGDHGQAATPPARGAWVISSTNHRLASHLQAIAVCRNWSATITSNGKSRQQGHAPLYTLSLHRRRTHKMSKRLPGLVFEQEPGWQDERVWCVKTTTRNIITRRRGTVTVMGNTEGFDEPSVGCILIARPTKSRPLFTQMIGRGTRPHPGKEDCLILDLAGIAGRHDLATVAELAQVDPAELEGRTITEALAARQEREREEGPADSGDDGLRLPTVTAVVPLFRSQMHWLKVRGEYVLSIGTYTDRNGQDWGQGHVHLVPAGETWRVEGRRRGRPAKALADGLSLEYAQGLGEDIARRYGGTVARSDAPWRAKPAKPGQLEALRRWHVKIPAGAELTRGQAADLLTQAAATARKGTR